MDRLSLIRKLEQGDFDAHVELSGYAFQAEMAPEVREQHRGRFKPDPWVGAFEDGKLLSQMALMDFTMYINEVPFAMGGIGGVATWPEERRKGLVAKQLVWALEAMRERGQSISALAPFAFGFYRKYGWELYTELKEYRIATSKLPRRQEVSGEVRRINAAEQVETLGMLYAVYAVKYNGTLQRPAQWWKDALLPRKHGYAAIYYDETGSPGGYMLYQIKDREMAIHELVSLSEQAWRGLWVFIAQHDSMIDQVKLTAPADDRLPYLLDDPRIVQELIPYFMARIVDAERFVAQYRFVGSDKLARAGDNRLLLDIQDAHAPWNQGLWLLTVMADGGGSLAAVPTAAQAAVPSGTTAERAEKSDNSRPLRLSCGIGDLTAMMLGYADPVVLHAHGRVGGDAAAAKLLGELIPQRTPYLLDYF